MKDRLIKLIKQQHPLVTPEELAERIMRLVGGITINQLAATFNVDDDEIPELVRPEEKRWLLNIEIDCTKVKPECLMMIPGALGKSSYLCMTERYDTEEECAQLLSHISITCISQFIKDILFAFIKEASARESFSVKNFQGIEVDIQICDTRKNHGK